MRTISPKAARCVRWTVGRCRPHVRAARTIHFLLRCELRQAAQQRLVACVVAQRKRHVCKSLLRILHFGQCVRCPSRIVCRMLHTPSGTHSRTKHEKFLQVSEETHARPDAMHPGVTP